MNLANQSVTVSPGARSMELEIRQRLFDLQDIKYRDFHSKLIPNIDKECIIGVRKPALRKLAKEYSKRDGIEAFLDTLPHRYNDEYNLHGFIISELKDYAETVRRLDAFLPYVDNWATCDQLLPKALKTDLLRLLNSIRVWLASEHPYTVRFGVNCLMQGYLGDAFDSAQLEMVAALRQEDYYVRMGVAWYFATALALQYDAALPFIQEHRLDPWTHNKAIQKAIESYRITDEQKAYLRSLKVKLPKQS